MKCVHVCVRIWTVNDLIYILVQRPAMWVVRPLLESLYCHPRAPPMCKLNVGGIHSLVIPWCLLSPWKQVCSLFGIKLSPCFHFSKPLLARRLFCIYLNHNFLLFISIKWNHYGYMAELSPAYSSFPPHSSIIPSQLPLDWSHFFSFASRPRK